MRRPLFLAIDTLALLAGDRLDLLRLCGFGRRGVAFRRGTLVDRLGLGCLLVLAATLARFLLLAVQQWRSVRIFRCLAGLCGLLFRHGFTGLGRLFCLDRRLCWLFNLGRRSGRLAGICRSFRRLLSRRRCLCRLFGGRLAVALLRLFGLSLLRRLLGGRCFGRLLCSGRFGLDCLGRWLLGSCLFCRRGLFRRSRLRGGFGLGCCLGLRCRLFRRCLLGRRRLLGGSRGLFCRCGFLCWLLLRAGCAILSRLALQTLGLGEDRAKGGASRCSVERLGSLQRIGAQWRRGHQQAKRRAGQYPWLAFHRSYSPWWMSHRSQNRLAGAFVPDRAVVRVSSFSRPVSRRDHVRIAEFAAAGAEIADARCLTFGAAGLTCRPWPSPSGKPSRWRR